MQLESMAAVVRPRGPWEAIDLGFQMARAWAGPILRSWMVIVAPFYFGLALLGAFHTGWWTPLVWWWSKPLYDRVPLHVLSRALFGHVPKVEEVRKTLPGLFLSRSLGALTFFRLDPMRSFVMPIGRLEGLEGAPHRQRAAVLKRGRDAATSSWLTPICFVFELSVFAALISLLDLLRPEHLEMSFWQIFTFLGDAEAPLWYYFLAATLYFVAMTLIEPFYVAGGFALYLNRRTELEGWDVELAFRKLARRLRAGAPPGASQQSRNDPLAALGVSLGGAVFLLSLFAASFLMAPSLGAQERAPERDPQEAIGEILADPDFGGKRTAKVWRPRNPGEESSEPEFGSELLAGLFEIFAAAFRLVLWIVLAGAVLFLGIALWRRHRPELRSENPPVEAGSTIVAGLDVSSGALPDDVLQEALRRWRRSDIEGALNLLYRGALAWLVDRRYLPARESFTEGDCLRHLRQSRESEPRGSAPPASAPRQPSLESELRSGALPESALVDFFEDLTSAWLVCAYAHRSPSEEKMNELTRRWPRHFASGHRP